MAATVLVIVTVFVVYWFTPIRRLERRLKKTLKLIGADTLTNVVIPDGVDGEIQIDQVLLTARGLLVLEIKRVDGTVFGGERLDNWTALTPSSRVAFNNPLDLLNRRVIALRARFGDEVPVDGRVVLVGNVTLGADLPPSVTTPTLLAEQFAQAPARSARAELSAYYPHWDRLRQEVAA
ncbi:MAG: nuclease-related domain-containing protein [Gammaproteobacteria bacterium]